MEKGYMYKLTVSEIMELGKMVKELQHLVVRYFERL